MAVGPGDTVTEATATFDTLTFTLDVAGDPWPGDVADTGTEVAPTATPVTRPVPFTVATAGFPLGPQTIVRPVAESDAPVEENRAAVSCVVPATVTVAGEGEMVTEATGR